MDYLTSNKCFRNAVLHTKTYSNIDFGSDYPYANKGWKYKI